MKTKKILIMIILVVMLAACSKDIRKGQNNEVSIVGSGNVVSEEKNISGFDQIEVTLPFYVNITQGEEFSVVIFSDDNFINFIQATKQGTTLSIDYKPGYAYDVKNLTMIVEVTMPELTGIRLNGSSHAKLNSFQNLEKLEAKLTGSSFLEGDLEIEELSLNISGSALARLVGSGKTLTIETCGNGVADLTGYQVADAMVDSSCNSTAVVNVKRKMDVEAAQHARVYYVGLPESGIRKVYEFAAIAPKPEG